MDSEQIKKEIKNIISKHLENDEFDYNTDVTDIGVDSVTRIDMMIDIESHFDVKIDDDQFNMLNTIENIATFISDLIS